MMHEEHTIPEVVSEQDELIEQIKEVIYSDVRPFIEMDGGRIEFSRLEGNVVYVRLFGACLGCPSSPLTLKGGVEKTVRKKLPQIASVELEDVQPLAARPI